VERDSLTTRHACQEGARIYGPGRANQGWFARSLQGWIHGGPGRKFGFPPGYTEPRNSSR